MNESKLQIAGTSHMVFMMLATFSTLEEGAHLFLENNPWKS
jgi:hypothetical protein